MHMTYVELNSVVPNSESQVVPQRENVDHRNFIAQLERVFIVSNSMRKRNTKEVQTNYCELKITAMRSVIRIICKHLSHRKRHLISSRHWEGL